MLKRNFDKMLIKKGIDNGCVRNFVWANLSVKGRQRVKPSRTAIQKVLFEYAGEFGLAYKLWKPKRRLPKGWREGP